MLQERAEQHFVIAGLDAIKAMKVGMMRIEDYYQSIELLKDQAERQKNEIKKWQK